MVKRQYHASIPTRRARAALAVSLGIAVGAYVIARAHVYSAWGADIDQSWAGALALRDGANPYVAIGPTGTFLRWPWPLFYPLPALLLALPLSALPMGIARAAFLSVSTAWLAYAVTQRGYWRLAIFASAAFLGAIASGAWEPLLMAAALTPAAAAILIAKPNVGAALACALPFRRTTVIGLRGAAVLFAVSLAVRPGWVPEWRSALRSGTHSAGPITRPGGFLVLAALAKWRRADARLLVAMASVPQSMILQAALPLFFVTRHCVEIMLLALLLYIPFAVQLHYAAANAPFPVLTAHTGNAMALCLYLPCLVMVLLRPNQWCGLDDPPLTLRRTK